jgi:hypothetical protein
MIDITATASNHGKRHHDEICYKPAVLEKVFAESQQMQDLF